MTFSNNILSSIRHIIFISIPISICPCNDETETDDLRANKNSHRLLFVFHSSVCSFTQSINTLSFSRILFALDCQLIAYNKYLFTRSFFVCFATKSSSFALVICHSEQRIKIFIPILLFAYRSHFIPCFAMFPLTFFVCRPMVNRCRVHSFIVSRYIHSNGLCRCFPFPAYFY